MHGKILRDQPGIWYIKGARIISPWFEFGNVKSGWHSVSDGNPRRLTCGLMHSVTVKGPTYRCLSFGHIDPRIRKSLVESITLLLIAKASGGCLLRS
jgi:hypothetical protein